MFGFNNLGLADGPDATSNQGIFELGGTNVSQPSQLVRNLGHDWTWNGRAWQCCECMRMTTNRSSNRQQCHGVPTSIGIAVAQAKANGHSLIGARDSTGAPAIWCNKCDSYGSSTAVHLTNRCMKPTRQGKTVLCRLTRGCHPEGCKRMQSTGIPLI